MTSLAASLESQRSCKDGSVDLADIRSAVEQRLEMHVDLGPTVPENLQGAIRHALLGQSKRIRPVLLFMIASPAADLRNAVLDAGCAVEMVHTASLILDDLPCMDDASLRRRQATTHIAFGQSTAILGAIALLSRAFGIIATLEDVAPETRNRIAAVLSDAVGWDGLTAGQEIDINKRSTLGNAEAIEDLNWLKTGVLFAAAARIGAIIRGLENQELDAIGRFARHLGLAFQTADDLIDTTDNVEEAGKDVGKDSEKATLVSLFGTEHARLSCQQHLHQAERALAASGIEAAPIRDLMTRFFKHRQASPS